MNPVWFAVVTCLAMVWFLGRSLHGYRGLPNLPLSWRRTEADVTVVIPARNESGRIGRAVGGFAGVRVIVVDDGSTDGTGEESLASGAEVLTAPPLPAGWRGKPHACWFGSQSVTTEWILFVDADTCYDPQFLSSAVFYAEQESLDALTVFLRQRRESWVERILLPYAFALYFCGVNAKSVNAVGRGEALANGQCFLLRTSAYRELGGHAAVAGSVIEDVALAREVKRRGLRLRVVRGEHLGEVRMYDSLRSLWQGFRKNSFRFLQANPKSGVEVVAASIALTSLGPAVLLLAGAGLWWAAVALLLLPAALLAPWYGGFREALTAPLAIYLFQLIALDGMLTVLTGRKARWKGREV